MNRAPAMREMDAAAATGRLALQQCNACAACQYPPRALCRHCLSEDLSWHIMDHMTGEILAITTLHHSHEPAMRPLLPVRVGLVRLNAGPSAICFVPDAEAGAPVRVRAALDAQGRAVMTAERMP